MRRMSLMPFNIVEQSAKLHEEILSQLKQPNADEPAKDDKKIELSNLIPE